MPGFSHGCSHGLGFSARSGSSRETPRGAGQRRGTTKPRRGAGSGTGSTASHRLAKAEPTVAFPWAEMGKRRWGQQVDLRKSPSALPARRAPWQTQGDSSPPAHPASPLFASSLPACTVSMERYFKFKSDGSDPFLFAEQHRAVSPRRVIWKGLRNQAAFSLGS